MDIQTIKQRFGIIGNDPALNNAIEIASRVASTDLSVLITGESGVGKEFFPQIIHSLSARKHNKYIAVNCGAIPEGTIDSELFGHEKGSFTGATEGRKGYFEEVDGGTIFLDEVADLPQSTQVRLLRVLQSGEFIRVGSSKIQKTNVRVVAATNINLQSAIGAGRFREDLFYRLNTVPIIIPSLRQRRDDIFMLFRKFTSDIAHNYRMPAISLTDGAKVLLENYSWPGNIRQLKSVAEQISAIEQSRVIDENTLKKYLPQVQTSPIAIGAGSYGTSSERDMLYSVLFEMRSDMFELKQMVTQLLAKSGAEGVIPNKISGLLTSGYDSEFALSEEIVDDPKEEKTKEMVQRELITNALRKHNGRRKDAAKELFMSERTLYRKIKDLGIDEN